MEKRGQVWIETVIYTLIGLTILGMVISIVTPKISQINDKIVITQTIDSMNKLNEQIRDALTYTGSQREILLMVKRGEYFIDGSSNLIYFFLKNTGYQYSEMNQSFKQGDITVLTTEKGNKKYDISLMLNFSLFNITYSGADINKTLTTAPTAYRLLAINEGGADRRINIQLV